MTYIKELLFYIGILTFTLASIQLYKVLDEKHLKARTEAVREIIQKTSEASFKAGYEEGKRDRTWKQLALQDHQFSRNVCTAWWFGSNATERNLK